MVVAEVILVLGKQEALQAKVSQAREVLMVGDFVVWEGPQAMACLEQEPKDCQVLAQEGYRVL